MSKVLLAFLTHILTASGGAFALLAIVAVAEKQWSMLFVWLLAAQFVDGIDGPIARKIEVRKILPNWSGDSLDFVIDYVTYVFIPAFALVYADLIPGSLGMIAACIIVITGGLYFADDRMKTNSNAFRGFPAVWNAVLFYFFIFPPGAVGGFVLVLLLAAGQFVPVEFIHPVRVVKYRPLTLALVALWSASAIHVTYNDMVPTLLDQIILGLTGLYFFAIGPFLQFTRKA